MKHPAKFTDVILDRARPFVQAKGGLWLDPFAGSGKIHLLNDVCKTIGVEIEQEWADLHPDTICGDSTMLLLLFKMGLFDGIFTSPTYGNRMADHHNAQDGSTRHTYTHYLGRTLHDNNSGKMQWGEAYRTLHRAVWWQCFCVLKPGGMMLVNVSNHIRKGVEIPVVSWHFDTLRELGFERNTELMIPTPRLGHGENDKARVDHEVLLVMTKPQGALT